MLDSTSEIIHSKKHGYNIHIFLMFLEIVLNRWGGATYFFEKLDFELAMGPLGYPSEPTFLRFLEVLKLFGATP